jgi:hypothetical protein
MLYYWAMTLWAMITDILYTVTLYKFMLKSGRLREHPRVIHFGRMTEQAETIQREVGLGPGHCPWVLNNRTINEIWVLDPRLPLAYTH